jgi:hypothetical protein
MPQCEGAALEPLEPCSDCLSIVASGICSKCGDIFCARCFEEHSLEVENDT